MIKLIKNENNITTEKAFHIASIWQTIGNCQANSLSNIIKVCISIRLIYKIIFLNIFLNIMMFQDFRSARFLC